MSGITSLQNVAPRERQSARETDRETETHRGCRDRQTVRLERQTDRQRRQERVAGVLFLFLEREGLREREREKERQIDPVTERGRSYTDRRRD